MKSSIYLILSAALLLLFACKKTEVEPEVPVLNTAEWEGVYEGDFTVTHVYCNSNGSTESDTTWTGADWVRLKVSQADSTVQFQSGSTLNYLFEDKIRLVQEGTNCTLGEKCFYYNYSYQYYFKEEGETAINPSAKEIHFIHHDYTYGCGKTIEFRGVKN